MAEYLRAREAFAFTSKATGLPRVVSAGTLFDADDPDIKGKEHLFEPVANVVERAKASTGRPVETASAAPGEKRTRSTRPVKRVSESPTTIPVVSPPGDDDDGEAGA